MNYDYIITIDTLNGKKSSVKKIKTTSEDLVSEYSTHIGTLSGTELSGIASKLKSLIDRLKNGGSNSNSWYEDYIDQVNDLEESLANLDVIDLTEPIEFAGEFIDMFGRVTMPIIQTGGDIHANATLVNLKGVNGENLILSASGYVFPFAEGVYAPITSHVGLRDAPTAGASTNHAGTDIGVPTGTPIYSLYGGTVINAGRGDAGGFGNWVRVQQDDGNIVIYGHVSKSDYFSVGQRVEAGDHIADVGSEGISTGPHLHLEIHDANGNLKDSENYFSDVWK